MELDSLGRESERCDLFRSALMLWRQKTSHSTYNYWQAVVASNNNTHPMPSGFQPPLLVEDFSCEGG